MASYDFSGPFVAARIVDSDGHLFPLWTNIQQSTQSTFDNRAELELKALSYLQSVTVELNLAGLPKISATIAPTFEAGIRFLDSRLADSGGANFLEVQLGYTGGVGSASAILSPVYGGMLLNPEVTIGDEVSIQLNAQGTGGFSLVRSTGTRTARPQERRRELIQRIVAGPNRARRLTVNFEDADQNEASRRALDEAVSYTQGGRTDWFAIWELANSANCWLLLVGNELRVLSRANRLSGPPTRELYLHGYPGGRLQGLTRRPNKTQEDAVGRYPILSFESPTSAVYLPGAVRGIVMEDVNPRTRQTSRTDIDDASVRQPRTARGAAAPQGDAVLPRRENSTGDGGERRPGSPGDRDAVRAAQQDFRRGGNLGVQIEVETLGIPDIVPGEIVKVVGVGQRFERHNYAVHKVVHNIGLDGYTTQMTCVSNVDSLLRGLQARGPANTQRSQPARTNTATAQPNTRQAAPP